jgi:hypothetical protein
MSFRIRILIDNADPDPEGGKSAHKKKKTYVRRPEKILKYVFSMQPYFRQGIWFKNFDGEKN